jgi:hypothetical protein
MAWRDGGNVAAFPALCGLFGVRDSSGVPALRRVLKKIMRMPDARAFELERRHAARQRDEKSTLHK